MSEQFQKAQGLGFRGPVTRISALREPRWYVRIFADVHDLSVKVTNAGYLGASANVQLLRKQRSDIDQFISDIDRPRGLSKPIHQAHGHDGHIGIRERQHVGNGLNPPSPGMGTTCNAVSPPRARAVASSRAIANSVLRGSPATMPAVVRFSPTPVCFAGVNSFSTAGAPCAATVARAWNAIARASTRPEVMERPPSCASARCAAPSA